MAVLETRAGDPAASSGWNLCKRLWREQVAHRAAASAAVLPLASANSSPQQQDSSNVHNGEKPIVRAVAKALSLHKRRLSFDPEKKLYFPYVPGKQATSAIRIKNISHTQIAFKFQTTAPKSCFMRPPNGVLSPGESIVATVVKFIQHAERAHRKQTRDKFKIISLKIAEGVDFTPELFDEQKDLVSVEQILCVRFLDPEHPTSELEKLKIRIAEADALKKAYKESVSEEKGPMRFIGEGNVLEAWNKMKLARHLMRDDMREDSD